MRCLVLAISALVLSGCVALGGGYDRLEPGATRAQVLKSMEGCPNNTQVAGRYEAIVYSNRMPHFFQWAPATYTFILKDGVLLEYGEGVPLPQGTPEAPTLVLVRTGQQAAR